MGAEVNTAYCPTCCELKPFAEIGEVKLPREQVNLYRHHGAVAIAVEFADCLHHAKVITNLDANTTT